MRNQQQQQPKILWSCVTRDGTILAEAAAAADFVQAERSVAQTARELMARKPTPGFEFHTQRCSRLASLTSFGRANELAITEGPRKGRPLKGIKFHVYERLRGDSEEPPLERTASNLRVWIFGAVYDPLTTERREVQSFLEKIVTISENFREHDSEWQTAGTLGLQGTFATILQQRMEEVTYLGKMAAMETQIQACQWHLERNVQLLLERGEKLEDLQANATITQEMALVFKKQSKKVRRMHMLKNAKHGLLLGTAVTAAVAIVVIPSLIAIL
jgi:hypothetical protein